MCRYGFNPPRMQYICIPCRKHWRGPNSRYTGSLHCPHCGAEGVAVGYDFHAPRRADERQWRKLAILVANGQNFMSCGCHGPGPMPRTLSDAKSQYGLRRRRLKAA